VGQCGGGPDLETLAAASAHRVSIGGDFCVAALGAFLRAAREVRERGTFGFLDDGVSSRELSPFMIGRAWPADLGGMGLASHPLTRCRALS